MQDISKVYVDDSVMPWRNNNSYMFPSWNGKSKFSFTFEDNIMYSGIFALTSVINENHLIYRYYEKLD